MNFEEIFGAIMESKLAPFRSELGRLTAEVEAVRRGLPPVLVTVAEAARVLGVSRSTIKRRVKDGSLPVRRVGRLLRVDMAAAQAPTNIEVIRMLEKVRHG